jgi:hypothetical protein
LAGVNILILAETIAEERLKNWHNDAGSDFFSRKENRIPEIRGKILLSEDDFFELFKRPSSGFNKIFPVKEETEQR